MRIRIFSLLAMLGLLLGVIAPWQQLQAQEARGQIVGKVNDPSGAAISNASINVVNKSMGTSQIVNSNDVGFYQASYLIPGLYRLQVEVPGFKKYVRDDLEVRVNDRLELTITLDVGTADQSVTVVGETPLLSTGTASIGQVIDSRRVSELPVPHGNPYFLIGLASGVVFNRDSRLDRPFEPTHIVGYSMDGTRANRSDITLDGAPSTATAGNNEVTASYVPPADTIAEFKVQTATFDASFGQTEGGVTNITIKSGTNELHGTAYYTKMVPNLFANDFFANASRTPRPDFTYNRWGGSLGGPVALPKLYDGRNKTFFLFGYEGIKESRPRNNGNFSVPTEKMKQGDFSELLALGPQYVIHNPFTRREVSPGRYQADPFPGNLIPQNLWDPVGKSILQNYYPAPRSAGLADQTQNYQRPELQETADYGTYTVRVDHTVSNANRLFGRVNWYDRDSFYNDYFDNAASGNAFKFISRGGVLDDVHTINATTVLNVRYGYNRFIRIDAGVPNSVGFDLTSLGFPAYMNNFTSDELRRFPRIDLTGYQGTGYAGETRPNDIHSLNATVSTSQGSHFIKGGTEFRAYRENAVAYANEITGRFTFDSTWTRGPLDNASAPPNSIGHSVAALLLGLPTQNQGNSYIRRALSYAEQSTSWGFFLHDDWKASEKLTLNIGLRWEFETPLEERYNRSVRGFNPAAQQAFASAARQAYGNAPLSEVAIGQFNPNGGLLFAGENGQSGGLYESPKLNLMPRFGFAYQVTPKTVVRGGYGIFYGFLGQRRGDVISNGFARNTDFVATNDNVNFVGRLSNPFPSGQILQPFGSGLGILTGVGESISFFNTDPDMPHMQRWQIGGQREFAGGFLGEVSYVGNRGTRIELTRNINAVPNQYLSTNALRDDQKIAYLTQQVPNPFRGLVPTTPALNTAATLPRERLLRPYPQFNDVNTTNNQGYSWYHSLQMQLEKRFAQGYTIQANYTLSKFMQATEYLNPADPFPSEVISDFDVPHRLTVSGIYELPFGRGRAFAAESNALVNGIIGGWQLSGIYAFQSGVPLNFGNIALVGNPGDIRIDNPTRERWFNIDSAAFGQRFIPNATNSAQIANPALNLANNLRYAPFRFSDVRGDVVNNWDLSAIKNTRFGERYNLQFRAEFLNAFNRVQFPSPNLDPRNVAFGQINTSTQANYARRIQLTGKFIF